MPLFADNSYPSLTRCFKGTSSFVRLKENINKYWDGNAVYSKVVYELIHTTNATVNKRKARSWVKWWEGVKGKGLGWGTSLNAHDGCNAAWLLLLVLFSFNYCLSYSPSIIACPNLLQLLLVLFSFKYCLSYSFSSNYCLSYSLSTIACHILFQVSFVIFSFNYCFTILLQLLLFLFSFNYCFSYSPSVIAFPVILQCYLLLVIFSFDYRLSHLFYFNYCLLYYVLAMACPFPFSASALIGVLYEVTCHFRSSLSNLVKLTT